MRYYVFIHSHCSYIDSFNSSCLSSCSIRKHLIFSARKLPLRFSAAVIVSTSILYQVSIILGIPFEMLHIIMILFCSFSRKYWQYPQSQIDTMCACCMHAISNMCMHVHMYEYHCVLADLFLSEWPFVLLSLNAWTITAGKRNRVCAMARKDWFFWWSLYCNRGDHTVPVECVHIIIIIMFSLTYLHTYSYILILVKSGNKAYPVWPLYFEIAKSRGGTTGTVQLSTISLWLNTNYPPTYNVIASYC